MTVKTGTAWLNSYVQCKYDTNKKPPQINNLRGLFMYGGEIGI